MIPLLFTLTFLEMLVVVGLLFDTPIRNLLMLGLGQLKSGRGQLVARTVAATLAVVFGAALSVVANLRRRASESGRMNPTDEVLMAYRLLETSLMGFCLFLYMLIDRLHYNTRELLRNTKKRSSKSGENYPNKTKLGASGDDKANLGGQVKDKSKS